MGRLRFTIAYHGGEFSGWQSQLNKNGVQDHLEAALATMTGDTVRVHGAGRTDAGVHALGQVAHVELDATRTPERWTRALNALLPREIRILGCRPVADSFHARFSARGKTYRYCVWAAPTVSPFEADRAWHVMAPFDYELFRRSAQVFVGDHDFAGFAAKRVRVRGETVRTIHAVRVTRRGAMIRIEFDGNGFLYKMVRLMTGALVRCALGKDDPRLLAERLHSAGVAHHYFVAPAHGLFLVRVRY